MDKLLCLLLVAVIVSSVTAGKCPRNYKPGDKFTGIGCSGCTCAEDGFHCVACPVQQYNEPSRGRNCYERTLYPGSDYPKCCERKLQCGGR